MRAAFIVVIAALSACAGPARSSRVAPVSAESCARADSVAGFIAELKYARDGGRWSVQTIDAGPATTRATRASLEAQKRSGATAVPSRRSSSGALVPAGTRSSPMVPQTLENVAVIPSLRERRDLFNRQIMRPKSEGATLPSRSACHPVE